MSRFAVIGASSFSGAAFCEYLRGCGDEVLELSRPRYDLNRSLDAILEALEAFRPAYVVNFAALNMVGESWQHWADYYRTNVLGVVGLAEALRGRGWLKKFLQVSTPEVYGSAPSNLRLPEGWALRPSTPYAVSRAATDLHLEAMHRQYGFPVVFTRTVNVYGPKQQPYRIIPKTVLSILRGRTLQLHGGGASRRSFIHITDYAAAARIVATDGVPGEVYHVATPDMVSIRDLVSRVCELMGVRSEDVVTDVPERPGKDPIYWLDDAKIRRDLGWRDTSALADGLAHAVAWFRERAAAYEAEGLEYAHRP